MEGRIKTRNNVKDRQSNIYSFKRALCYYLCRTWPKKGINTLFYYIGRDFLVEYEGLRLICFNCGKYGHEVQSCPSSVKPVEITSSEPGSMTRDQILRKG